jgi:hypothetical protein
MGQRTIKAAGARLGYLEPSLLALAGRDGRTELRPGMTVLRGRF